VNALRRRALLILIATATVIGLTAGTAQAAFTDRATMTTLTVGSLTVTAPTSIQVNSSCTTTDLNVTLTWKTSTTAKVSGYDITAYTSSGQVLETFSTGATATSYSVSASKAYASYGLRVTVTTQTSYGWTAESPKSGAITC